MKNLKVYYWIAASLFSVWMVFSGLNFLLKTEAVVSIVTSLDFPTFIIRPLGVMKILGVVAILTRLSNRLKELAFAGFFFDFIMATVSHIQAEDGMFIMPIIAILLLFITYFLDKRVFDGY